MHQKFSESSRETRRNNKIRMKRISENTVERIQRATIDRIQIFSNESYIIGDPDPSAYHRLHPVGTLRNSLYDSVDLL